MTTHPQTFNTLVRPQKGQKAIRNYCEEVDKIFNLIKVGQPSFLSKYSPQELCLLRITNYNRNVLHVAIWYSQQNLVEALCSNKGFQSLLDDIDINGDTPLHIAVFCKNFDAFKRLTEAGASISSVNKHNEKPLDVADNPEEWQNFLCKVRELIPDPKMIRMSSHYEDKFNVKNINTPTYNTLTPTQLDVQTRKNVVADTRDRTTFEDKGMTSRNESGMESGMSKFGYRNEWETFLDTNQNETQGGALVSQRNTYKVNVEQPPEKLKEVFSDYAPSPMMADKNKLRNENNQDKFTFGRSSAPVQQNELQVNIPRPQNKASPLIKTFYQKKEPQKDPSSLLVPEKSPRDASFLSQDSQTALYREDE